MDINISNNIFFVLHTDQWCANVPKSEAGKVKAINQIQTKNRQPLKSINIRACKAQ